MFLLLAAALARAADPLGEALDRDALIRAVLDANPEVAAAEAALDAARAHVDVVGRVPDPTLEVGVAPLSVNAHTFGWSAQVMQDLPLWGMRRTEKDMASADADAAEAQLAMMRLDLARMAAMLWADWWAIHRQIALMEASLRAVDDSRDAALSRYAAGRGASVDTLALATQSAAILAEHHLMEFEREVVRARVNALLHRPSDTALPPPPDTLLADGAEGEPDRPELVEADAMVRAAEAGVAMARRERLPMVGVMAGWDTMQEMPEHRLMAGVTVALPLSTRSRAGAVAEAEALRDRAEAERARMADAVALSVVEARLRWEGQKAATEVIEAELLPLARAQVEAARAAWAAGATDVRTLLDAERSLLDAEIRHATAAAALAMRAAELQIALGALPGDGGPR